MAAAKNVTDTPLMRQYTAFKEQYPDAILLFRVGDFYETFGDDAISTSGALGITLTKRGSGYANSMPLAGFPYHALDTYLPKLVRKGFRVAVCDQLEDPKLTKKLVKRGVTELVTPGVAMADNILDPRQNNFLSAVYAEKEVVGASFLDLSTGEYYITQGDVNYIDKQLSNYAPKEILILRGTKQKFEAMFPQKYLTYEMEDWVFTYESAMERLLKQFKTNSLKGFGVEGMKQGQVAAGAILHYLDQTQHTETGHINQIRRIEEEKIVWLDNFTVRNLEIFNSSAEDGDGKCTLISVLDSSVTPMGARMMRRWVSQPLKDIEEIQARHGIIDTFFAERDLRGIVEDALQRIGDLERIVSRVASKRVSPRELRTLASALYNIEPVRKACSESGNATLRQIGERINPCLGIADRIISTIVADPPAVLAKGGVIADGCDAKLDEWRAFAKDSKGALIGIQNREAEATGIPLKVGYNNVFGYYLEVRNTHKNKVPSEWIRKQTLTGAERYITQELKEFEDKITHAYDEIMPLEMRIYEGLVEEVGEYISVIQTDTALIAKLDCLLAFWRNAERYKYVRPIVNDGLRIDIREGRHPVIERQLPIDSPYVTNSVLLENEGTQIMMITGPNMAGKSALLRQTALIVLMAQIGSFVPADSAEIGVVDKVFTRVGASDNISVGESTFMVEMTEAANIINNITDRSLVLFDELGRGTSTYDGISIAWSIVEYLHENDTANPKTLFATHYHELNEMERTFRRIRNFNVSVKEENGRVIFLRKLKEGGSEHSFGIHVAKIAGMPGSIVRRADEILARLEAENKNEVVEKRTTTSEKVAKATAKGAVQLSMFELEDPVLARVRDELLGVDIDNLTPIAALNKLSEIREIVSG